MNINFGLFPGLPPSNNKDGKQILLKGVNKKKALAERALKDIKTWSAQNCFSGTRSVPKEN